MPQRPRQDDPGAKPPRQTRSKGAAPADLATVPSAVPLPDGDATVADPPVKAVDATPSAADRELLDRLFGSGIAAEDETDGEPRSGFVALIGQPNVGKSTLLNALVGEKVAIVSPRPQTTRRRILGIRTEGRSQAVFIDTPGLHRPAHELGKSMVRSARSGIRDADLLLWVVDASRHPDGADAVTAGRLKRAERPVILVLNKADLLAPEEVQPRLAAYQAVIGPAAVDWVLTVATKGQALPALWAAIRARLPAHAFLYEADQLTDQTDRQFAAELIREAALRHLQEEVPHGLEVLIEDWKTREDGLVQIGAKLVLERPGHKAIVIGKGGQMLKAIGSAARREIERALEARVFLELFVTVKPQWRRSPVEVRRLGFD